jgi:hypothetical protein
MNGNHLEPARSVIAKAGGVDAVASITGKHVSRIYRWMYAKDKGGTGGQVPYDDALKLLAHARVEGLSLDASDFFPVPHEVAR